VNVELLRIGDVARRAGVSRRTVDFYTRMGLLQPAKRSQGNYRLYPPESVDRIHLIRRLEEQGVPLADVAEEYSDAICHVTTRQDFQLHFVHLEDTPDLMRRLAAVQRDRERLEEASRTLREAVELAATERPLVDLIDSGEEQPPATETYWVGSRPEHDDAIASIRARRAQREAAEEASLTPYQRTIRDMAREKGPDLPASPYPRGFNRRESVFSRYPRTVIYGLGLVAATALAYGHGVVSDATY
jgi:DNA-binding transcriptional MerR regulator